jgi:hypothetical protein
MNKRGQKPDKLETIQEKDEKRPAADYENVVGQDSLTRFDNNRKKQNKHKKPNKPIQSAAPQQGEPRLGRPQPKLQTDLQDNKTPKITAQPAQNQQQAQTQAKPQAAGDNNNRNKKHRHKPVKKNNNGNNENKSEAN